MKSNLEETTDDVSEPRPRRVHSNPVSGDMPSTTEHSSSGHLADESSSRPVSYTPPLPAMDGSRPTFDPLEDFSHETSNLEATDRCLAAACSLLQFQIAEVLRRFFTQQYCNSAFFGG